VLCTLGYRFEGVAFDSTPLSPCGDSQAYLLVLSTSRTATPHDQEPAPCVQPKPAILSPLLQVPALLLLLAIAAAVAVREAAFCLKVSL
jgi:hypothetical protein